MTISPLQSGPEAQGAPALHLECWRGREQPDPVESASAHVRDQETQEVAGLSGPQQVLPSLWQGSRSGLSDS